MSSLVPLSKLSTFFFAETQAQREGRCGRSQSMQLRLQGKKTSKTTSGRFGTTDLSKCTNQEVLFFKLLPEVSLSTTCLKTTSKSDYNNVKKEKKMCHSAQDKITCLWQKSKPFNRKLEEFNLRKSFH